MPKTADRVPTLPIQPLVWLNLLCLDAPLVAVSWALLFARGFRMPIAIGGMSALFLTAWLIYLIDRFGDSVWVENAHPTSLRQRFCRCYSVAWLACSALIAATDIVVIFTALDARQLGLGAGVGACALVYLIVNRTLPSVWLILPVKEISIGFLFAAGTMVPLAGGLTNAVLLAWLLFSGLCCLNCICIAVWERHLDAAQQRVSIATAFPNASRALVPLLLLLLGLASLACGLFATEAQSVYICIAASAGMLASVHVFRHDIALDLRTALADLVLLTPALSLLMR